MAKRTITDKVQYQGMPTLEVLEEAANYNSWIASQISSHVTPPVLEIGSGTGNLTKYFLTNRPLHITDKDSGLVNHLKQRYSTEKNIAVSMLDVSQKPTKNMLNRYSSAFAINVLEHIDEDVLALKNICKMLKKNGKLLLLVPAKKFAYTKLDKELGHYRRYEKYELEEKLKESGFVIEKIYFFNIVGLLSWTVRNKVKKNNVHLKPYHIKLFDSIVPLLRIMESFIKIPIGISLIVIAKKI